MKTILTALTLTVGGSAWGATNPPLNVNVTNTPLAVSVTSGASNQNVSVTNTVATRAVDNPAQQPFQTTIHTSLAPGESSEGLPFFTVPNGKRLVIEFVNVYAELPTGQKPFETAISVAPINWVFPATFQATTPNSLDIWVGTSPTRLYVEPGTSVSLTFGRNGSDGSYSGLVSVSGYLVNVP